MFIKPHLIINHLTAILTDNINSIFEYTFFIDIDGSIKDKNITDCIDELKEDANDIKVLGSYPKSSLN